MPELSLLGGNHVIEAAIDATISAGKVLTGGAANTKGNYVQLVASAPRDVFGLTLIATPQAMTDFLIDVAIGANPNEKVIIPDLQIGGRAQDVHGYAWIPIRIPKGSEVRARCQAITASATLRLASYFDPGSLLMGPPLTMMTAYGVNTADSGGTGLDPGGSANTKPALPLTQIVASTGKRCRALYVSIGCRGNATQGAAAHWLVDIGIGASSSEKIIIPDLHAAVSTGEGFGPFWHGPFFVNVPAGTRIGARAACSIIDATDRLIDVAVYGLS